MHRSVSLRDPDLRSTVGPYVPRGTPTSSPVPVTPRFPFNSRKENRGIPNNYSDLPQRLKPGARDPSETKVGNKRTEDFCHPNGPRRPQSTVPKIKESKKLNEPSRNPFTAVRTDSEDYRFTLVV